MSFFELDYIEDYVRMYNAYAGEGAALLPIASEMFVRPQTFNDEFKELCSTESMKRGLDYMIDAYNKQTVTPSIFDVIVFNRNGQKKGFVFVKTLDFCVKSSAKTIVISIEGICSIEKGVGKILLGFTILNALRKNAELLLQVDNGFSNPVAYCLYSNMGFEIDINLVPNCYNFTESRLVMKLKNGLTENEIFTPKYKEFCTDTHNQVKNANTNKFIYNLLNLDNTQTKRSKTLIKNLIKNLTREEFELVVQHLLSEPEFASQFVNSIRQNQTAVEQTIYLLIEKNKTDPLRMVEGGKNKTKKHKKHNLKKNKTHNRKYKNKTKNAKHK